jgi:hypothetical protein
MKQAGKGDRYRPVDQKKWDEGYERVFGQRDPCDGCTYDACPPICPAAEEYPRRPRKRNQTPADPILFPEAAKRERELEGDTT